MKVEEVVLDILGQVLVLNKEFLSYNTESAESYEQYRLAISVLEGIGLCQISKTEFVWMGPRIAVNRDIASTFSKNRLTLHKNITYLKERYEALMERMKVPVQCLDIPNMTNILIVEDISTLMVDRWDDHTVFIMGTGIKFFPFQK